MTKNMKAAYRMFRRKGRQNFYIQNNSTGEQQCLGTSDESEAQRLLDAMNQERQTPALNMQLGKAYIMDADPKMAIRIQMETLKTEIPSASHRLRDLANSLTDLYQRNKRELSRQSKYAWWSLMFGIIGVVLAVAFGFASIPSVAKVFRSPEATNSVESPHTLTIESLEFAYQRY